MRALTRLSAALLGAALIVPLAGAPASALPPPLGSGTYQWCGLDVDGNDYLCMKASPTTARQWDQVMITGWLSKAARTGDQARYVKDGMWLYRLVGNTLTRLDISAPVRGDGTFTMPAKLGMVGTFSYVVGVKNLSGNGDDDPPATAEFALTTLPQGTPVGPKPKVVTSIPSSGTKRITADAGQTVVFQLASNITTGYAYQVDTLRDTADASVVGPTYAPPTNPIPGKGGTTVVRVVPGHSGLVTLRFSYGRPGEAADEVTKVVIAFMND